MSPVSHATLQSIIGLCLGGTQLRFFALEHEVPILRTRPLITPLTSVSDASPPPPFCRNGAALTMPGLTTIITAPVLFFISIPLALLAVVTTTLTFWVLLLRVSVVYVDLILALLRAYIIPTETNLAAAARLETPPKSPTFDRAAHRRQKSRSSSIGSESAKRASAARSDSFASLVGTGTNRDFEGVGGWRVPGDEQEESLWMGMNSRLELPAAPIRRHQRTSTGGSQKFGSSSEIVSLEVVRTPLHAPNGSRRRSASGTASPESYFAVPHRGSMTALTSAGDRGSKVSFEDKRKSSSSSSTSLGSVITVTRGR